jgi:hypothetical protein
VLDAVWKKRRGVLVKCPERPAVVVDDTESLLGNPTRLGEIWMKGAPVGCGTLRLSVQHCDFQLTLVQ